MGVLDDYLVHPGLSLLEKTRIQAQVLVPVLRALRSELGKAMHSAMADITECEVTVEMRRHDKEALEFDVTQCRFAEFFRALGEPEIGALLICETDFDIAAAGGGDVSLTRDQTIMQGAPSCTFRYRFAPR
jgi:hypothetical protein